MKTEQIAKFAEEIAEQNDVYKIILYNHKITPLGDVTSFKICVIINDGSANLVERRIYVEHDIEIPFDVLVYTKERWLCLCEKPFSFASRIEQMGRVVYG